MRFGTINRSLFFISITALLLFGNGASAPVIGRQTLVAAGVAPSVRISEIHYDNAGTDSGEAIEVSSPAGMSLAGWQIVLYNGSSTSLAVYDTKTLTGLTPSICGARSVVQDVIGGRSTYPRSGRECDRDVVALSGTASSSASTPTSRGRHSWRVHRRRRRSHS